LAFVIRIFHDAARSSECQIQFEFMLAQIFSSGHMIRSV